MQNLKACPLTNSEQLIDIITELNGKQVDPSVEIKVDQPIATYSAEQ